MTVHFNKARERWTYDFRAGGRRFQGYCQNPADGSPVKTHADAVAAEMAIRQSHRGRAAPSMMGFVYFMLTTDARLVKIGWSRQPQRRLKSIQTSSAVGVTMIGHHPGTAFQERRHHDALAAYRSHGEWFHAEPEVLAYADWALKSSKAQENLAASGIIRTKYFSLTKVADAQKPLKRDVA